MKRETPSFHPQGDDAIAVRFGNRISKEINDAIRRFVHVLRQKRVPGIEDIIPGYAEVNIRYDLERYYYEDMVDILYALLDAVFDVEPPEAKCIHIPVCYGGGYGPDIETVAAHNGLTVDEVIDIHASVTYLVYMLGFSPGFPYLGGMDPRIAAPRLAEPRQEIPAGSVGIAGEQTGVYPNKSPGGWQLIGKTPLKLFDIERAPVFLVNPGDSVRFHPIDEHTYLEMEGGAGV